MTEKFFRAVNQKKIKINENPWQKPLVCELPDQVHSYAQNRSK